GMHLIEVDRVLRPGGYFVWTSPYANTPASVRDKENLKRWDFVQERATWPSRAALNSKELAVHGDLSACCMIGMFLLFLLEIRVGQLGGSAGLGNRSNGLDAAC
nr:probable pectin methyltransferase QUA2 [Tanacetum cinerariifolium]